MIPQKVTSEQINSHLKYITVGLTEEAKKDLEIKYSRFVALAQTEARLNMIAFDLHEHFINYVKPKGFKAMLTCASRAEAVQIFYKLRDLGGVTPAVVITPNSGREGDDENNTPQTEKIIGEFFRKEVDPLFKNNYDAYEDSVTGRFIDPEEVYRKDYLFFKKLKDSVSLRFNDRVDFSRYEDGIRQLLNTYVNAEDAKILIEPLDITNKEKMEEQLARLGSSEAKAEAIQTRQVEVLESQRYVDPIRYMTFMERIKKTLSDYMQERDSEKYLSYFLSAFSASGEYL